ncbi:MAG: class I SAM-dependent methyltransferase [Myxococcota bacterium]
MNPTTRNQLLDLSRAFYEAHAEAFDASRGHQPWPGWARLLPALPALPRLEPDAEPGADTKTAPRRLRVLDIGCGNARFARFLHDAGVALDYKGLDANAALLDAARERLPEELQDAVELEEHDFLAGEAPGAELPPGPFDLIVLMGVLHHVPGADWRQALLEASAARLAPGGILALAAWQFGGRPRFEKRTVAWESLGEILGSPVDLSTLEPGDTLLRFGDVPFAPPRYCHQVAEGEFMGWPEALDLEGLDEYRADGSEGDLNRYWVLRRT